MGYLEQEPQLDEKKDVIGNVMEGVKQKVKILERYEEVKDELEEKPNVCLCLCIEINSNVMSVG